MKCKDCAYWTRKKYPHEPEPEKVGNCKCDKFVYTGGFDDNETPIDGLGYSDYESYSACFETGENFGCIHFKKHE
jgi:hypothetical protein